MSEGKSFFNEHFAAIITTVVSISAVLVSMVQVWVATINKDKELELAQSTAAEARALDELKSSRAWKLGLAEFMADHREAIFSEGEDGRQLQKVMLATFPPEVTLSVFGSLSKISSPGNDQFWSSAERDASTLHYPRVKIYYERAFPDKLLDLIGDTLAEGEVAYDYKDQLVPEGLTQGDVRFFHSDDEALARGVKQDFELLACFSGYELKLKLIPLTLSQQRAPKGTVEVWLPSTVVGAMPSCKAG